MIGQQNISDLFFKAAKLYPANKAIIDAGKHLTYSELEQEVKTTVNYFLAKGLKKGDRVLLFVPMSKELYRIVLALFRMGAVAVFLDEWVNKTRMEACCRIANCKAFIGIPKLHILRLFSKELRTIPLILKIKPKLIAKEFAIEPTFKDDTALITFTTGSTGTPKAAKRTHAFLLEQFDALKEKINPQPQDFDMSLLPIVLLINLGIGTSSVITKFKAAKPLSFKPDLIYSQIMLHKVNRISASPYFIRQLSLYLIRSQKQLPCVKQVFTGGAPVFPSEAKLFTKAFPDADVQIVYGSTEAEPISSISAKALEDCRPDIKGLPVGKPYHKAEVKIITITEKPIIVDSENEINSCRNYEVGEIIVAGPHVLKEYINNPEAIKRNKIILPLKTFHRTGDSGYLDNSGNLFLTGPCVSIFVANGKTIYPFLFENHFQNINDVVLGTVIFYNSKLTAAIETSENASKERIESQIQTFEIVPDQIIFLKKIPRDPRHHSKIDYDKLKKVLKNDSHIRF